MEIQSICAYNVSRNVLLSEHVAEVSHGLEPQHFLALLFNGPGISQQSAVWLTSFTGTIEWPARLFAFDVVYLDDKFQILEAATVGPGSDFPSLQPDVASILFLPDRRIEQSGSTRGNVIRICAEAELAAEIGPASYSSSTPREAHVQAQSLQNQSEEFSQAEVFSLEGRRLQGFAFEPFAGTLMYLPDPVAPAQQSSEYFLIREGPVGLPSIPVQDSAAEDLEVNAEPIPPQVSETLKTNKEPEAEPEPQLSPALRAKILEMDEELQRLREERRRRRWKEQKPEAESARANPDQQSHLFIQPVPEPLLPLVDQPVSTINLPVETPLNEEVDQAEVGPEDVVAALARPEIENQPVAPGSGSTTKETVREWESIEERVQGRSAGGIQEGTSLGVRFRRWLSGVGGSRARRFRRFPLPGLVAFYWTGGAPKPHEIVNISKSGFYLRTKDLWLPDTLVRMTLQRPDHEAREGKRTIGVLARVVRIDDDGVGHEFVTTETLLGLRTREILPEKGTSTKELERFLSAG